MIYITFRDSNFDDSQSIKNVWNLKYEQVDELYIAFMQKKAEVMNIAINPHWLNILNYQDHNNHLTELEYNIKVKEWSKKLKEYNIDKFISEILNGRKEKFFEIHKF